MSHQAQCDDRDCKEEAETVWKEEIEFAFEDIDPKSFCHRPIYDVDPRVEGQSGDGDIRQSLIEQSFGYFETFR